MGILNDVVFTNRYGGTIFGHFEHPDYIALPDGSGRMIATATDGRPETYTYWQLVDGLYQQVTTEQASAIMAAAFVKYFGGVPVSPTTVQVEYTVPTIEVIGQPDYTGAGP